MSYEIINTHVHIFPDKIAQKATTSIGNFYDLPMEEVGTVTNLLSEIKENSIKHCFILSTATTPMQVREINNFQIGILKEYGRDLFTAFGTVHPDMDNPINEIDYMRANGIIGIKFHNDFQKIAVDDKRMFTIYEKAQAEKIPIIVHAGDSRYSFSNPLQLKKVYDNFHDLYFIAAHFGGYSMWDDSIRLLKETNFYFDTSSSLFALNPDKAVNIINTLGIEKFFFGTDFPMWGFKKEIERFLKLPLTEEQKDLIFNKNAKHFLKIINNYWTGD